MKKMLKKKMNCDIMLAALLRSLFHLAETAFSKKTRTLFLRQIRVASKQETKTVS